MSKIQVAQNAHPNSPFEKTGGNKKGLRKHGLLTTRCAAHIINLPICVGLLATPYLWPRSSPVQASTGERGEARSFQERITLELGKPIERELSGGLSHYYKITMISGQFLHLVIDQRGINVSVSLFAPDGKKIGEADSENLIEGSETVIAIGEASGEYLIEVRSPEKTAKTGRYEVKVEELRSAAAEDKYRVAGDLIFKEAERLQSGTLEAKRKSNEKYHEAVDSYRRANDRKREATTINNIGGIYWSLGEMQKALEKHNEALPLMRAVGDRGGEAVTLSGIGEVYRSAGEMEKALEKYNEALPIHRAVGDRTGEAITLLGFGAVYQSLGETQKALEKYNEALSLIREVGFRKGEALALLRIAQVEQKRGNLTQARQVIEQAVSMVESMRPGIAGQERRASYFVPCQTVFESFISVLMEQHRQNPAAGIDAIALAVSERARARFLLELLKESRADIRQGVDSSVLEREHSLQQRLNEKAVAQARLLNRKHTYEQADATTKEITSIPSEYEELRKTVAKVTMVMTKYAVTQDPDSHFEVI